MSHSTHPPVTPTITELRRAIDLWRRRHPERSQLPDELAAAATDLARVHGCARTADALQISKSSLYRWLRERAPQQSPPPPETLTLVEVAAPSNAACTSPVLPQASQLPALDLRAPDGTSLRLDLPTDGRIDVLALVDLFLRSRTCSR